jgi:hypothetical protein
LVQEKKASDSAAFFVQFRRSAAVTVPGLDDDLGAFGAVAVPAAVMAAIVVPLLGQHLPIAAVEMPVMVTILTGPGAALSVAFFRRIAARTG